MLLAGKRTAQVKISQVTGASEISLDGSGHLELTPTADGSGNWYSARIETQRADFRPPSGGELKIEARQLRDRGRLGRPARQQHRAG